MEIGRMKFLQKSSFKTLFAVSPFLFGNVILTGESDTYWFSLVPIIVNYIWVYGGSCKHLNP